MDDWYIYLNNGEPVVVRQADVSIDPLENALVFTYEGGSQCKFYWPNVALYQPVNSNA